MADGLIQVEVAYAKPDQQTLISLNLPSGSSVAQAISASGLLQQCPEIDLSQQKIGIFGQVCKLDTLLSEGDRVEIYRPLQQNPMDARRGRLQK